MVKDIIIKPVYKKFTDGYWDVDAALKYTSILFPHVQVDQKVRDALRALNCKKEKDNRFRELRRSAETDMNFHNILREIEYLLEKENIQYKKKYPAEEKRDSRDIFMMLIPTLMSQKGNINITLDINELNSSIYGECKECNIRETCKEAFSVVNEYVSYSLNKLDFEIPSEK